MNRLPLNRMLRIVFIAAVVATLAGCGNKGPLVLPTPPAPIEPATVPETPAEPVPADTAPAEPVPDSTEPPAETPATPTPPATDGDGNG